MRVEPLAVSLALMSVGHTSALPCRLVCFFRGARSLRKK